MSSIKILIVEDEEDARMAFVRILGRKGYSSIQEASKGSVAINIIEKEKPDIVFLDILLADNIDGMEVLKQGKAKSPQTEIVMMSANQSEYEAEAQRLGAYNFVKKPIVKMEILINLIEEVRKMKNLV